MNNQSLMGVLKKDSQYRMFFHKDNDLHMITLRDQTMSIKDAITYTINQLNNQRYLDISNDQNMYQVYGARKSGKKKDGLPAFQKTQLLAHTCIKYFYLKPIFKKLQLMSKNSSKSIQTQISLDSKMKNQVTQNFIFGCFCLRKGSMV